MTITGFANDFESSVARAAALQELYGAGEQKVLVVLFAWPSNGRVQPTALNIVLIARALGCTTDFLLGVEKGER